MNTELKNAVLATDLKAQYDACAKKLLGYKDILARILIEAVEEFRGISPEEVKSLIEDDIQIGKVPVDSGITNVIVGVDEDGKEIIGMNTVNEELNAGYILFDIIFYVRLQDGHSKIIINVEAQRKEPTEYDILNRAIFYVSREISSQKNREFVNSNYNDIKKVYSIWICMNMPEDSMNHIHLINDTIIGNQIWKGREDLVNIVMVGLAKEISAKEEKYELHRLLGTLLSETLKEEEKLDILKNEYHIPMKKSIKEDVKIMCNLSEGIEERGIIKGKAELLKQQVQKKLAKGKSIEVIADELEEEVADIKVLIDELEAK
ncbi:MAG: hypothetical protein ACLUP8_08915 [Ruminococcus sp.]|uniref:hypothetical protein n=1 Tax=Ruminococcus sp. TaxID=41978 RepID=UPI0039913603